MTSTYPALKNGYHRVGKEQPEKIAKYTVSHELGRGAMGVVYAGRDPSIDRPVAIKVLHPHLMQNDQGMDLAERFNQEAKAAARVLHQNIVAIFDYGVEDEAPYIVMEYVEGDNLKKIIANDGINSVAQAINITEQILSALAIAHSNGVVHRDIKPENIILMANGQVKVSDFGVARLDTSDLTSAGMMVGTPKYMSPEGLQGEKVDGRSDIYSTGLVLLEMITKLKLHPGMTLDVMIEELMRFTANTDVDLLALSECIKRSLAKERENRYLNAADFSKELQTLMLRQKMSLSQLGTGFAQHQSSESLASTSVMSVSGASQWDVSILKELEKSLAKYTGPMAGMLVKKSSRKCASIAELSQTLCEHIPLENERSQFLDNIRSSGFYQRSAEPVSSVVQAQTLLGDVGESLLNPKVAPISSTLVEEITSQLAYYMGPLASRLVKKTLKKCDDLLVFIESLSKHIDNEAERASFVAACKKIIE